MNKDYFWNTLAGILDAAEAVIIIIFVTRLIGLEDAGHFTFAFAIGNLMMSIGKYGVYTYQVSDRDEYPYTAYFTARIITVVLMLACIISYCSYGIVYMEYDMHKVGIIISIGVIYCIEAFEDLLKANLHSLGFLYVGAIIFIIRWLFILLTFVIMVIITNNSFLAISVSALISFFVFIICRHFVKNKYLCSPLLGSDDRKAFKNNSSMALKVLVSCFPMFLYNFLLFYVINSPKYALEKYATPQIQACFGFVSMPVFLISLISGFIFQPQLVSITNEFHDGKNDLLRLRIKKQLLTIIVLTMIFCWGASGIFIRFLSLLYNVNLNTYRVEFIIMMFAGGLLAISAYQAALITIIRKQAWLIRGYIPVAIIAFFLYKPMFIKYGTIGMSVSYTILNLLLSCIFFTVIFQQIRD